MSRPSRHPSRKPLDRDLYADVVAEAKQRFDVWPSAYASGWVVKTYKERGGRYAGGAGGDKKTRSGLTKWFGEEWVDLSRPIHDEDGELVGYEPCGRKKSNDPAAYPKCRPLKEAMRMSPSEVKDAIKRKRAAEAKAGRGGARGRGGRGARAPVRVSTYRKNPDVTRTQAFRRWFGDSKVVDENGEPLVVWHGHQSEAGSFHVFDFDRAIDLGMHFGTKQAAKDAVKGRKSRENVRPFYLSLQNPLLLTDPSDWIGVFQVPVLEELLREGVITKKQHKEAYAKVKALASKSAVEKALRSRDRAFVKERSVAVSQIVRDVIVDAGYDGVVYANETEDVGSFSWVAFHPEQIKLADGTNTTFDPTNPDVRANPAHEPVVVLYHRTTPANAAKIVRESRWMSREQPPYVFFSTDPYGHGTSYGEALLEVVVPEDVARLDDEFPSGEQHYAVLTRDLVGLPVRWVDEG